MEKLTQYGASKQQWDEQALYPALTLARVVSQARDCCRIVAESGEYLADVSGKFRHTATQPSDYPAVGDFVLVDPLTMASGSAVIQRVLTRKSVFMRTAVGNVHQSQVVAANIDIVFVCMALNSDYNLSRLERYLSVAWDSGAVPIVVLTKADLCEDLPRRVCEAEAVAPGTEVLVTSGLQQNSCRILSDRLKPGVTASLIGSSGVGKSTLINCLLGADSQATSTVRQDGKGRHTTTRRDLLLLPQGGIVIDTPGMRELGAERVDLSRSFSDIDALAGQCRFRDCTHTTEPGCAVVQALQNGTLEQRRLDSYQKLKREARYDGLGFKALEAEKLNTMFEQIGGMKKARKYIRQTNKRTGEF